MPSSSVRRLAAAFFAFTVAQPAAAEDVSLDRLAGWWMAVDDTQPALWRLGESIPVEEFLVFGDGGSAESRFMRFFIPDASLCRGADSPGEWFCADAPLLQSATAAVEGGRLVFRDSAPGADVVDRPQSDDLIRAATVIAHAAWQAEFAADGRVLVLESAAGDPVRRTFARVAPQRIGRLRAAFIALEQPAALQWRCFLTAATAGDPAFAALGRQAAPPPAWVEDWLEAESYRSTLQAFSFWPGAAMPLDPVFIEPFDMAVPQSRDELAAMRMAFAYLGARAAGLSDEDATKATGVAGSSLPIGEAAIATLGRGSDPVIKAMVSCPDDG